MRVLIFGDSITQGLWDTEGGWAGRLIKHYFTLAVKDLRRDNQPDVFNLGVSGGTSKSNLDRLENEIKARIYRGSEVIVVISTGLNDSYKLEDGNYNSTPEEYAKNMDLMVKKAQIYSQKIMFVGLVAVDESQTTPVFWRDIEYANSRIAQFEDAMAKVAKENDLTFVPIHEVFKTKLEAGKNLLADGLHPNDAGHELIFQMVRPELDKLLKSK